jgi:hypothetical protein
LFARPAMIGSTLCSDMCLKNNSVHFASLRASVLLLFSKLILES